jgi:hypothetical protein
LTARLCYVRQSDRGARLIAVRVIAERVGSLADERWSPRAGEPSPLESAEAAADWLDDRLRTLPGRPGHLDAICIDPDGSLCSWISTPSTEPAVIAAISRQSDAALDAASGRSSAQSPLSFFSATPLEASVQALGSPHADPAASNGTAASTAPAGGTRRTAVLAGADAAARTFVDALDRRRTHVDTVLSLWHAMALAWDPGAPGAAPAKGRDALVSTFDQVAAILLITSDSRLLWCWSRQSRVIAGGSIRLPSKFVSSDQPPIVVLGTDQAARLTTEWLAWAAQLGCVPARIVAVLPDETSATLADNAPTGPSAFAGALAASWPGAPIDAAPHADPLQATLRRAALSLEAGAESRGLAAPASNTPDALGGTQLRGLSSRPGHSHRALYVWSALAAASAALAIGLIAWSIRRESQQTRLAADRLFTQAEALVVARIPDALSRPVAPVELVRDLVTAQENRLRRPSDLTPAMPVLEELETLSFVLGSADYEITEVRMSEIAPLIRLTVPSLRDYEELVDALPRISGSFCDWRLSQQSGAGSDRLNVTMTGSWTPEARTRVSSRPPASPASGSAGGQSPASASTK